MAQWIGEQRVKRLLSDESMPDPMEEREMYREWWREDGVAPTAGLGTHH